MGGEKSRLRSRKTRKWGSPPRGRGKGGAGALILGQIGITPAWAGKSTPYFFATAQMEGSPPRRRGKGILLGTGCKGLRITPAWAGKSDAALFIENATRDHPRVGGEK